MRKITSRIIAGVMVLASVLMVDSAVVQGKGIQSTTAAKKAALKKVPSATVKEIDTDMENGVAVYDVELYKKNKEYTLKYRASDGKLLEYGWEIMNPARTNQSKQTLTKKAIKKKAKKQVKNASVLSVALNYDDGIEQYKIRLTKGSKKYVLVYDSKSGKLLDYEWEITTVKTSSSSSSGYIGVEKAKSIALKKAPNATVVKAKLDKDDGVAIYEIEMVEGRYEYEVEINAKTGKIIKFEKDIDD